MGLKANTGKKTYLSIREGKIAKKDGEQYLMFDSIEGYLVGLSTRDGKYGTELCIDIKDDELYQLQIRIKGEDGGKQTTHFISFAHCSPNIDVSKKIEFIPSLKIVEDKKRSALFFKQGGEILKWAFKRGEGMPDPEEVFNKKGELVSVDWSEVEAFRLDKVNELAARVSESKEFNTMVAGPSVTEDTPAAESDDLPF
jgi:hypothetical protein